jgi:diguanylate cyclase (GGDEF)-like protein/PAS domain S-box-containing protein
MNAEPAPHPILARQLRKLGLSADVAPDRAAWQALIERVSRAYAEADQERYLLERSLARSSEEMQGLYADVAAREARLRSLVHNVSDIITIYEPDGTVRYESPAVERVLGYRPEELVGDAAAGLVHPDDLPRLQALYAVVLAQPGSQPPIELRVRHKEGGWRHLEVALTNLLDDPGVRGIVGHSRDVTERKGFERRLQQIVDASPDLIMIVDAEGRITFVNAAYATVLGYPPAALIGRWAFAGVAPEDQKAMAPILDAFRAGEGLAVPPELAAMAVTFRVAHADGHWVTVEARARLLMDEAGVPAGLLVVARDISERMRAEEELRHAERRYRQLFEEAPVMYAITRSVDGTPVIADCNALFAETVGCPRAALIGRPLAEFYAPASQAALLEAGGYRRALAGRFATEERQLVGGDGRVVETLLREVPERDSTGAVVGTRAMFVDITERKALEERLRQQAFTDDLTGLPNRALFLDRLAHALAIADQHGTTVAALFLDLDSFKLINDSLGHAAGDELLTAVAARLRRALRPTDTLARFGGDEFTVLLEDVATPAAALDEAARLLDALRTPFALADREVFVSTSIGVAVSAAGTSAEAQLRQADIALYQAKAAGKAQAALFQAEMSEAVIARLALGTDLRRAVEREEFTLHYQPEVDLRTGVLAGLEALVRWRHPERGWIPPAEFIPLAEETGLILALGRWVLSAACRQVAAWQALRPKEPPLVVSVNVSARQLLQDDFVAAVQATLRATGLPPACLRLEITESLVMENLTAANTALDRLKALGVGLAIDDFGTGYSSLSYLRRLPVDTVKIDRSFVQELDTDAGTVAIVRAVVTLAHTLGMAVTAEGVETAEQLAQVRALCCDRAQGYYFARPLPAREIPRVLREGVPSCCDRAVHQVGAG